MTEVSIASLSPPFFPPFANADFLAHSYSLSLLSPLSERPSELPSIKPSEPSSTESSRPSPRRKREETREDPIRESRSSSSGLREEDEVEQLVEVEEL